MYFLVVSLFVLCIPEPCFAEKGKGRHAQAWLTDICPQYFQPRVSAIEGAIIVLLQKIGVVIDTNGRSRWPRTAGKSESYLQNLGL